MEFAISKIERRMAKQEQLIVQIAAEAAHVKIELEDVRKTVVAFRQSGASGNRKISESFEGTPALSAKQQFLLPGRQSLESTPPSPLPGKQVVAGAPRPPPPDRQSDISTRDSVEGQTPKNLSIPPTPAAGKDPSRDTSDTSKTEGKAEENTGRESANEGNFHKMIAKSTNTKSGTTLISEAGTSRSRFFRTGSLLSDNNPKAPDMTDGALGLRKKMTTKIFTAVLVPEKNTTTVFVMAHPIRGKFRQVTEQPLFEFVFASFVIASAILIGVETESEATNSGHSGTPYLLAQSVCALAFVTEIVIRLISYGSNFFGVGNGRVAKEWKWNMFDLVCLFTTVADIFCELFVFDGHHELLTAFRQFRIVRAARVLRVLRFSYEFRKMSYALQYSGSTLLWALITLCCVIFFFATALTQATTEHLQSFAGGELDITARRLKENYGTMPRSFHSLFQAISGGKDWGTELMPPLMQLGWILPALFLAYIALTIFGVMNVLTSVFVESAVASYQHYKDILIQENLSSMQVYIAHLKEIFVQIDFDNSGEVSMEELEVFLNDPSLQQYLESIDVHPDDARTLFRLLDKDNSGMININEFCNGCLRLKGEAKSFDIHCIIYENERLMHKFQEFITYLERGFLARVDKSVDQKIGNLPMPPSALSNASKGDSSPRTKVSQKESVSFHPNEFEQRFGRINPIESEQSFGRMSLPKVCNEEFPREPTIDRETTSSSDHRATNQVNASDGFYKKSKPLPHEIGIDAPASDDELEQWA